ncbi:cytochrome c biogenesis protein [Arcanobacterium wilhelmae]|uniref:Cytochrome c biogenesis protein n=1 Tax=Arcanobacterium wilhelmae TaxID=1803177 RepID=A0ABT9NCW6_9ACTO|nr:cytochrome c biogenesis protein ResB [Arcanobacterium wilhelmae]MDP9801567.1 cytochrome c biogenesis protein [Arcanobacterium wilhelmae]WFN90894.1 cytochrome c biogenesis protein ResB [Arcanobacterium wilhelmae]
MSDRMDNGPVDGLDGVNFSARQIARAVYAFFYNKRVGLILILIVSVLSLIGVLVPQVSNEVRAHPESWASFLDRVSEVYGGWTRVLAFLGMFTIFSSWVYLGAMVLLCLSIIGCTAHRLPLLYRNAFKPHVNARGSFFERARLREEFSTPATADDIEAALRVQTKRWHGRVLEGRSGEERNFYVDRFRLAPFGTALSHAAFVIIICGFVVSSMTGFRDESFTLTVGMDKEVGHSTGLTARAESFRDTYYDSGKPKDYVTDLVISRGGTQVARQEVRVNSPMTVDGVTFHQASFGISGVLKVEDASGKVVFHDGVPLTSTTSDGNYSFGTVRVDGLDVYVVASASGHQNADIRAGQARLEVYPAGEKTPTATKVVDQGQAEKLGELTYTFEREAQYTGILVKNDPGTWVVWLGAALLAIGTTLTMVWRHHRIWVRITPGEGGGTRVQFASHDKAELGFERQFSQFAHSTVEIIQKDVTNA